MVEFSSFCIINSDCPCCNSKMSNSTNGGSNDVLEGLQPHQGIYDVHDLQFGDVGLDDASLADSQEDNMRQDSDPINAILERQAKAIEKLATGIKDIAQALREIALALAPKNQPVVPAESIESPIE